MNCYWPRKKAQLLIRSSHGNIANIRPTMHWDACPRTLRMQEVRETDQRRKNDLKTTLFRKSMLLLTPIPDLGGKFHSTQKDKYSLEHVRSWISLNNTKVLSPFGFIIWWMVVSFKWLCESVDYWIYLPSNSPGRFFGLRSVSRVWAARQQLAKAARHKEEAVAQVGWSRHAKWSQ